jgi:predicted nicotinamide N-methyase
MHDCPPAFCWPSLHAAALLLGAESAIGTDTDPLAVRAAAANAALNGLEQRFQLLQCGANLSDPDPMLQVGGVGDLVRGKFTLGVRNSQLHLSRRP